MEEYEVKNRNIGRKIAKIRSFKGIKQEALALALGITQQAVSQLENEENISDERLKKVAEALGVTPEIIRGFDEDRIFFYINNLYNHDGSTGVVHGNQKNYNPIEKVVEIYERLLESEREKIEILKKNKSTK
jgi:transcriptional regulator with XRE-family HTH domain